MTDLRTFDDSTEAKETIIRLAHSLTEAGFCYSDSYLRIRAIAVKLMKNADNFLPVVQQLITRRESTKEELVCDFKEIILRKEGE